MKKNAHNFFVISSFFILILIPVIFSNKVGGEISEIENRYLAKFPVVFTDGMKLSPHINSDLNNWIEDNVGFRLQIQKILANLDYKIFHVSPSSKVLVGKDGWFYYTGDNNLSIAMGGFPLSDELLRAMAYNQTRIQMALRKEGIAYVIVLIPSKVSIYPEYIKGGQFIVQETPIDIVTNYLRKNTTIPVINTKKDLLSEKTSEQVFFKTDTHWNEVGAYVGYRSVISNLVERGIIQSGPVNVIYSPSNYKGEFSAMMGDAALLPPEPYKVAKIIAPNAIKNQEGESYAKMIDIIKQDNTILGYYNFQNPKAENKRALIYGDSFFFLENIPILFAENFSNLDLIRSDSIREKIIEQLKPDLVILERTERYVFTLAYPADPELVDTPPVTQH
jgi:alginate O-acetyltransferase complex protein AlgJ